MARTLTPPAQTEADATSARPFGVLIIRRAAGDLYYSDAVRQLTSYISTERAITSWGTIDLPGTPLGTQEAGAIFPLADYKPVIEVSDAARRDIFLSDLNAPVGARVDVFAFWNDPALSWPQDAVPLYQGTIGDIAGGSAQEFREGDVTVRLHLKDRLGTLLDRDVGDLADRDTFGNVLEDHEGRVLPLVYGTAKKVRAVCVKGPRRGRLMQRIDLDDGTLYIDGGEKFPQNTPITIRIGFEYIEGAMNGTVFTVTGRGAAIANFTTANPAHPAGDYRWIQSTDSTGIDDQWVGFFLGIPIGDHWAPEESPIEYNHVIGPGEEYITPAPPAHTNDYDGKQWRQILRYDAANKTFEVNMPFIREGLLEQAPSGGYTTFGHQIYVPANTAFTIGTLRAPHEAGDDVWEVLDEYVYVVDNAPSQSVDALFFQGIKGEWVSPSDWADQLIGSGGGVVGGAIVMPGLPLPAALPAAGASAPGAGAWSDVFGAQFKSENQEMCLIPTSYYTVNLNDATWAAVLGHNVTTITFQILPIWIPFWRPNDLEIWADLQGIDKDNPADAIEDMLINRIGVDAGVIDAASQAQAANDSNFLHFGAPIERIMPGREMVNFMARQSRIRVRFEAGTIFFAFMRNGLGPTVPPTVTRDIYVEDSVRLPWEDPDQVVNEIDYRFRDIDGATGAVSFDTGRISHAASVAAYGRKRGQLDCTLLVSPAQARQVAHFWVHRLGRPWRKINFRIMLPGLPYERDDTINVNVPEWDLDSTPAVVENLKHTLGAANRHDEINVLGRMPRYQGCTNSCEMFCETGCESDCQVWCQSACELDCEEACQVGCQSLCQHTCQTSAQGLHGCGVLCQVGNQVVIRDVPETYDGQGACAGGACQTCQGDCVTSCEVGCEIACQPASIVDQCDTLCIVGNCESACESGPCETVCEHGCVVLCEVVCEVGPCEAGSCEVSCQTPCVTGTQLCGGSCEGGCAVVCEIGCELACESAWIIDSCETACEEGNCETMCEAGTACETACQVGQTAVDDCDLACEPASAMAVDNLQCMDMAQVD